MQNSERLLLVFAGFFFGTIFGGLAVREFMQHDALPAGPAIDPAAQNGPMTRGSDGAGGGNQPGMEAGGAGGENSAAVMGKVTELLEKYRKSPEKFESQIGLGQLFMQKGDFTKAAEWYEKAYKQQPKNIDVLMDYGLCRLNMNDTASAEKLFQAALAEKPDLPEALYAMASITWGARQDAPGALKYLDKLEKIRPGDADCSKLRALIMSGKKPA